MTFTISKYTSETSGQFLKKLRLERGLEQRQLARKLRVHKNTVYEWEKDRKGPSRRSMEKLAKFLKISAKSPEEFETERETFLKQAASDVTVEPPQSSCSSLSPFLYILVDKKLISQFSQ